MPYVGSIRSQEISATLVGESHSSAVLYEGRSEWLVNGATKNVESVWADDGGDSDTSEAIWGAAETSAVNDPWGTKSVQKVSKKKGKKQVSNPWGGSKAKGWTENLTHFEVWDPRKGVIDEVFPANLSKIRGEKGEIQYNRETGFLETKTKDCRFILTRPKLQAEHCSAEQALIAGYLMMECS